MCGHSLAGSMVETRLRVPELKLPERTNALGDTVKLGFCVRRSSSLVDATLAPLTPTHPAPGGTVSWRSVGASTPDRLTSREASGSTVDAGTQFPLNGATGVAKRFGTA
jgi:hypothetical protein